MFYLPAKDWSPRFEDSFFTCSLTSRAVLQAPPDGNDDENIIHQHHPAVYFNIVVKCVHKEKICPRRYSQFRKLYDELRWNPPQSQSPLGAEAQPLRIPPKTCLFSKIDDEFLDIRQEELSEFLDELLKRPNYPTHPAVREFLGLDEIASR